MKSDVPVEDREVANVGGSMAGIEKRRNCYGLHRLTKPVSSRV
jgi:hypothetical protein